MQKLGGLFWKLSSGGDFLIAVTDQSTILSPVLYEKIVNFLSLIVVNSALELK